MEAERGKTPASGKLERRLLTMDSKLNGGVTSIFWSWGELEIGLSILCLADDVRGLDTECEVS